MSAPEFVEPVRGAKGQQLSRPEAGAPGPGKKAMEVRFPCLKHDYSTMFYSAEDEKRIHAEQQIMRAGLPADVSLCQYKELSCVRCCLAHIGGDSHVASGGYLGPGGLLMKFRNINPLKDPRIEASQYEDSFPDVGREEMERRFTERRRLFLEEYSPEEPRSSLIRYMKAAQKNEGYRYRHEASAGPFSMFVGGSVPKKLRKGELPECQLLGFVDGDQRVGCMAHPLAETSSGYDGRDQVGFFNHSGCCENVGCEASREFRFLSASAMKVFDRTVRGMSWYEYSRHATSVLVYYLRAFDHILQILDPDEPSLARLVGLTNRLYDEWPRREAPPGCMNSLDILTTDTPLSERILYIALDARFTKEHFVAQLEAARDLVSLVRATL